MSAFFIYNIKLTNYKNSPNKRIKVLEFVRYLSLIYKLIPWHLFEVQKFEITLFYVIL